MQTTYTSQVVPCDPSVGHELLSVSEKDSQTYRKIRQRLILGKSVSFGIQLGVWGVRGRK